MPEKLLPLQLVQLRDDVGEGSLDFRDDDVLDGVDSPVGHLDDFVQRDEGCLKGGQLDEEHHGFLIVLLQLGDLLPTPGQAGQLVRVRSVLVALENGQIHTGNVVFPRSNFELQKKVEI